ncbi:MAG: flagellar biosynthetic protein FliO [Terriglobales bacterium]
MSTHVIHGWDLRRWLAKPRGRRQRRLRLLETLALGERRFVGLVMVDGRELLVGATPHSMTLLAELGEPGVDEMVPVMTPPGREVQ